MTPRPLVDETAHCACGAVSVHLHGVIHAMFLCSCEDCQRTTGSGHSAVLLARASDVSVEGQTKGFTRPANSGADFTRDFCPECGVTVAARSSRATQLIILPAGLFGAGTTGWFKPNQLIFARSHLDWDTAAADLPWYQTYRGET